MGFFNRTKKKDGWLTVAFLRDGICVGRVRRVREAKAVVELSAFYPANANAAADSHTEIAAETVTCTCTCTVSMPHPR